MDDLRHVIHLYSLRMHARMQKKVEPTKKKKNIHPRKFEQISFKK